MNRRHARWGVVGAIICCGGCGFFTSRPMLGACRAHARVETVRLEEQSRSAPVPLTDAATRPVERAAETQPASRTLTLDIAEVRAAALANNLDLQVELLRPRDCQQLVAEEQARFEPAAGPRRGTLGRSRFPRQAWAVTRASFNPTTRACGAPAHRRHGRRRPVARPLPTSAAPLPAGPPMTAGCVVLAEPAPAPQCRRGRQYLLHPRRPGTSGRWSTAAPSSKPSASSPTPTAPTGSSRRPRRAGGPPAAVRAGAAAGRPGAERASMPAMSRESRSPARSRDLRPGSKTSSSPRRSCGAARANLKRMMNRADLPLDSETSVTPTTPPRPLGLDLAAAALADFAVENRMEMLELELQLALDESTIDLERNRLPLFTLDYNYNLVGAGRTPRQAFELDRNNAENWSISLAAEIPIGNRAAQSRVRRGARARAAAGDARAAATGDPPGGLRHGRPAPPGLAAHPRGPQRGGAGRPHVRGCAASSSWAAARARMSSMPPQAPRHRPVARDPRPERLPDRPGGHRLRHRHPPRPRPIGAAVREAGPRRADAAARVRRPMNNAPGGIRTHTALAGQRILSP